MPETFLLTIDEDGQVDIEDGRFSAVAPALLEALADEGIVFEGKMWVPCG